MALTPLSFLLLGGLVHAGFVPATSPCDVACSTDYDVSLNCSCTGPVPARPVLVHVSCSDGDKEVNGSCEVRPPESWCTMVLENLYVVASIGTMCSAATGHRGDGPRVSWALSDVVKLHPPSNVRVTPGDGFYNVTWDHQNRDDCITYRLRIRQSQHLSQDPVHSLEMETKQVQLDRSKLQPLVRYAADVQARMCPDHTYQGPWSEWSRAAEWRTDGEAEGLHGRWLYPSLAVSLLLCLLLLAYLLKPISQKVRLMMFIPKPEEFFYRGGNFKEWPKPVFGEYDYLASDKQLDVLRWSVEKRSRVDDGGGADAGLRLLAGDPLRSQEGDGSRGAGRSVGHISIHTVTLFGDEPEEEATARSLGDALRSRDGGRGFGSFEEDGGGHGLDGGGPSRGDVGDKMSDESAAGDVNRFNEAERASLDSFVSNEPSEDGYPQVDLDTVDSGFAECSSPGASDSGAGERADPHLFHEHKNSNYVKQWMICSTVHEENQVRGTQ